MAATSKTPTGSENLFCKASGDLWSPTLSKKGLAVIDRRYNQKELDEVDAA
jgi:hypothetical protein